MACDPERLTGYVDAELSPRLEQEVGKHLSGCPICAAQVVFELELRDTLRSLPAALPAGLPDRIRAGTLADARFRAH